MVKYNDLTEEFPFAVDLFEVFGVFLAEDKTGICIYPESDLGFEVAMDKIFDCSEQIGVVVIVPIDPVAFVILLNKTERADGMDVIIAVKFLRAAVLFNEFVHKDGGRLVCGNRLRLDITDLGQAFGIGERNAGSARTQPTGINAEDDLPGLCIVVKLVVKFLCNGQDLGILPEGIHHPNTARQCAGKIEIATEVEDVGGESGHGMKIGFRFYSGVITKSETSVLFSFQ